MDAYSYTSFFFLATLTAITSCSVKNQDVSIQDVIVHEGNIIYTYKSGKVQCLSQKNTSGSIAVLIQSLEKNTTIANVALGMIDQDCYTIKIMMAVNQENSGFKSWTDLQEVYIPIEPINVPEITLQGEPIITHDNVTVLMPYDANASQAKSVAPSFL